MTFRWNADDLDGVETIQSVNIALNDTNNFVTLDGSIRLITIRIEDLQSSPPQMEILINGSDQNILTERLPGLLLDEDNKFYVQAVDLSGAKSNRIMLPNTNEIWYVKKPKGKVLIFDDLPSTSSSNLLAKSFYRQMFSTIGGGSVAGKFDEYDLEGLALPFENLTLYETVKLFPYTLWYSGSGPRLDLLNIVTNKYLQQGGKIAFSMTLQDSSQSYPFDLSTLQGFLPIDSISQIISQVFLLSGADILPLTGVNYPSLKTAETIAFVRTFVPNSVITTEIYDITNQQISGTVGFITNDRSRFFIGLPLHQCNGGDENVDELLEKVFFEEFGLVP
jgi:hypothetical protein